MGYISEDYCSEELSGMLMERGYIGAINTYLGKDDINVKQITIQSAMKWLREIHNLFIQITIIPYTTVTIEQNYYIFAVCKDRRNLVHRSDHPHDSYSTYEQACEAAIKYCLENLI